MGWCDTNRMECLNGEPLKTEATYGLTIIFRGNSQINSIIKSVEQIVETAQPHEWNRCEVHGLKHIKEVIYGGR